MEATVNLEARTMDEVFKPLPAAKVLQFPNRVEPRAAHIAEKCVCLACKHQWIAVTPLPVLSLECPECHALRGVPTKHITYGDELQWACIHCSEIFFTCFLRDNRPTMACIGCGSTHDAIDLFPKT
jgi:hypothetical protein